MSSALMASTKTSEFSLMDWALRMLERMPVTTSVDLDRVRILSVLG